MAATGRKRTATLRGQKFARGTPPTGHPTVPARTTPPSGRTAPPAATPSFEDIEERLALDDLSGALELARLRLTALPGDRRTTGIVRRCEETLTEMYLSRLGDLKQRVHVKMSGRELQWLSIDHRAGFMLSRVDGPITIEELLEICGMPRLDALRMLHDLLQQKVVSLSSGC